MERQIAACYTDCKVPNCKNLVGRKGARGLCTKHYQMWRLTGNPEGSTAETTGTRFLKRVAKFGECWEWQGSKDQCGYGMFSVEGKSVRAHRWSYEFHIGSIPEGLQLDHLCRNPGCVNPDHLEPVTREENLDRGWGRRVKSGWVDHCIRGHRFTAENTYVNPKGALVCRECSAASRARYKQRKAA